MRTDGQTDMTKIILAFRNFANAPKKYEIRRMIVLSAEIKGYSIPGCIDYSTTYS